MNVLDNTPDWFDGLLARSLALVGRSHDVLESILGIGSLIARGEDREARRVAAQLQSQIEILENHPTVSGELDSTQLGEMLNSVSYPADLRAKIRAGLERE